MTNNTTAQEALEAALKAAEAHYDLPAELNLSNYTTDDVEELNNAYIQAHHALEMCEANIKQALRQMQPAPFTCPSCGGEADNGHDRELPPNPYNCTKCEVTHETND